MSTATNAITGDTPTRSLIAPAASTGTDEATAAIAAWVAPTRPRKCSGTRSSIKVWAATLTSEYENPSGSISAMAITPPPSNDPMLMLPSHKNAP